MPIQLLNQKKAEGSSRAEHFNAGYFAGLVEEARNAKHQLLEFPKRTSHGSNWDCMGHSSKLGEFFKGLSDEAISDFESLASHFSFSETTVLIWEDQKPSDVLFLTDGYVNLSMSSRNGRRLFLEMVGPGEILGLASAISGEPYNISAEARYPCRGSSLGREDFLNFLMRHPVASRNLARELTLQHNRACERLRIFGLVSSAQAKLASLFLGWRMGYRTTEHGIQIRCPLTHGEIGDCIGALRETITRTLNHFKELGLLEMRGSNLIIPSRSALADYVGIDTISDSGPPAA
jgi:CRP/FNR family transcriptional regulator, cyclic AMP receptor protein